MNKFRNKYLIPSARLQNWDYGWNASYFVTICTANRVCYFGDICNGAMKLSEIGIIIDQEWLKTFELRPDMNLQMREYVIMPNHFHGIITIGKNEYNSKNTTTDHELESTTDPELESTTNPELESTTNPELESTTNPVVDRRRDAMHCVSTPLPPTPPLQCSSTHRKNQFGPQSKNLASIIRGFKSAVTMNTRKIHAEFAWQSRFHDHIIRNDTEYQRIKNYIINNPKNWNSDKFYSI